METATVGVLDVSALGYGERLCAAALQGLANRQGPRLFLDYGPCDDPSCRRTNSVMMTEEDWFGRYRDFLVHNDLDNLAYYRGVNGFETRVLEDLDSAVLRHRDLLKGFVVYDPALPDSVNAALVYAGLEDLLVLPPHLVPWAQGLGLAAREDLRGRWKDRVELYEWALRELRPRCAPEAVASNEPEWERPEFADYIVKNRLFAFGLSSFGKSPGGRLGHAILLFLAAGPFRVRDAVFGLGLDRPLRRLALALLGRASCETSLLLRTLGSVEARPYPKLFGWHVERDDELSFMLLVSAAGMRLLPSFMAGNYSFHSALPARVPLRQDHLAPGAVRLEADKVYLCFTLSDGDQFALMNTAELGGYRRPERGSVPFNWEVQPFLAELAPALLGYYFDRRSPADLLVAGPSGAGYVIPSLVPDLPAYFRASAAICAQADLGIATSYGGDPPGRVLRDHAAAPGFLGYVAGYFHLGRTPAYIAGDKTFVANAWPPVERIGATRDETLAGIRALVEAEGPLPRFVGCHLFAYRTNVADIAGFVGTLDPARVKVVRADEFLAAARLHLEGSRRKGAKPGSGERGPGHSG